MLLNKALKNVGKLVCEIMWIYNYTNSQFLNPFESLFFSRDLKKAREGSSTPLGALEPLDTLPLAGHHLDMTD